MVKRIDNIFIEIKFISNHYVFFTNLQHSQTSRTRSLVSSKTGYIAIYIVNVYTAVSIIMESGVSCFVNSFSIVR